MDPGPGIRGGSSPEEKISLYNVGNLFSSYGIDWYSDSYSPVAWFKTSLLHYLTWLQGPVLLELQGKLTQSRSHNTFFFWITLVS
jgi:hypothetical protein